MSEVSHWFRIIVVNIVCIINQNKFIELFLDIFYYIDFSILYDIFNNTIHCNEHN